MKCKYKYIAGTIVIVGLIFVYKQFNPLNNVYFPKCPFYSLTGLKCPGCGSQRAIHHILNLDFIKAVQENMLLVLAVPYMLGGVYFEGIKNYNPGQLKARNMLYGEKAIYVVLVIVCAFWLARNLF